MTRLDATYPGAVDLAIAQACNGDLRNDYWRRTVMVLPDGRLVRCSWPHKILPGGETAPIPGASPRRYTPDRVLREAS